MASKYQSVHPMHDELLLQIDEFLKDVEKDVKLAKQIRSSIRRTEMLAGNWMDRRSSNNSPFCKMDGCTNIALYQYDYCSYHDRKVNRDY